MQEKSQHDRSGETWSDADTKVRNTDRSAVGQAEEHEQNAANAWVSNGGLPRNILYEIYSLRRGRGLGKKCCMWHEGGLHGEVCE